MQHEALLRLLVIGAHPDDAEYKAGGLAALYRSLGHEVKFISITNGEAGHHLARGPELVQRRRGEAEAAANPLGIVSEVWDHPDGWLEPTLERRGQVIRAIRSFQPDLVLTHRLNDYHPDHRATSYLVQDAAYLLTVPAICPDTPHLRRDPVIAYLSDDFTKPTPFQASVAIDTEPFWNAKIAMLHAHASQFYEWLPYNMRIENEVPESSAERFKWLSHLMAERSEALAKQVRGALVERYGPRHGTEARFVEAFEGSEYGAPLDKAAIERLFPKT